MRVITNFQSEKVKITSSNAISAWHRKLIRRVEKSSSFKPPNVSKFLWLTPACDNSFYLLFTVPCLS